MQAAVSSDVNPCVTGFGLAVSLHPVGGSTVVTGAGLMVTMSECSGPAVPSAALAW